ncbi:MAG: plastocyanin/azurin family copper-binding protein [Phycisphaerales bacterium]
MNRVHAGVVSLLALGGPGAVGVGGWTGAARADVVDVYVFDFDVSIYPPGEGPIVDPVIFVGDTIRWVWVHDFHNVVSCVGQVEFWESEVFQAGATFVYTFETPGVFQYYCTPHGQDNFDGTYSGMGGSITVLAVPAPGAAGVAVAGMLMVMGRRRRRV